MKERAFNSLKTSQTLIMGIELTDNEGRKDADGADDGVAIGVLLGVLLGLLVGWVDGNKLGDTLG